MINSDFLNSNIYVKKEDGKDVKYGVIVVPSSGNQYEIHRKYDSFGGFGRIYFGTRLSDGLQVVFKEFSYKNISQEKVLACNNIKSNIKKLINNPLMEADENVPLKHFLPILDDIVPLSSGGFGYFMKKIDTKQYITSIVKLHEREYAPDALALCEIVKNMCHVLSRIHRSGMFYKDINEGNIFVDYKNGDIVVADVDNITSEPKQKTAKGTEYYMAPEVYMDKDPDTYTDLFSLATYIYRLMVGGYPLEGKKTFTHILNSNKLSTEDNKRLFGTEALFAFDPKDKSNNIDNPETFLKKEEEIKVCKVQRRNWDAVPAPVKEAFIQTFSTCLKQNRNQRVSAAEWSKLFDLLEKNCITKCSCGKHEFNNRSNCRFCGSPLHHASTDVPSFMENVRLNRPWNENPKPEHKFVIKQEPGLGEALNKQAPELAFYDVNRKLRNYKIREGRVLASLFNPSLPNEPLFNLEFDAQKGNYVFRNVSAFDMEVMALFHDSDYKQKTININGEKHSRIRKTLKQNETFNIMRYNSELNVYFIYTFSANINGIPFNISIK